MGHNLGLQKYVVVRDLGAEHQSLLYVLHVVFFPIEKIDIISPNFV